MDGKVTAFGFHADVLAAASLERQPLGQPIEP